MASYGVKNLHDLASEADSELEKMGNSVSSMSEFKKLYGQYIEKYKGVLVTDSLISLMYLYMCRMETVQNLILQMKRVIMLLETR